MRQISGPTRPSQGTGLVFEEPIQPFRAYDGAYGGGCMAVGVFMVAAPGWGVPLCMPPPPPPPSILMHLPVQVETLVQFMPLECPEGGDVPEVDLGSGVKIKMVTSTTEGGGSKIDYVFEEAGETIAKVPDEVQLPDLEPSASALFRPFQPPTFGVTFLGTSHGFDPSGQTVRGGCLSSLCCVCEVS